jgi:hypothetical protein
MLTIAGCGDMEMEGCEETIINEKPCSSASQMGKGRSALDWRGLEKGGIV